MTSTAALILQAGPAPGNGGINPLLSMLPQMVLLIGIFYVLLIWPMRSKQKKLDALVKALKPGDRVIVNPGILATVAAIEEDSILVRIDDKAKMRVYRSAIAGLQAPLPEDNKEKS
jgi:preprotein translocase subunit YajC